MSARTGRTPARAAATPATANVNRPGADAVARSPARSRGWPYVNVASGEKRTWAAAAEARPTRSRPVLGAYDPPPENRALTEPRPRRGARVRHVAVHAVTRASTGRRRHPGSSRPPLRKRTALPGSASEMVAVIATRRPGAAGFCEDVTVVVVGAAPAAGAGTGAAEVARGGAGALAPGRS